MDLGGPAGGPDSGLTIKRSAVEAESGQCFIFRDSDRILTSCEAFDELTSELAEGLQGLPAEEKVLTGVDPTRQNVGFHVNETVNRKCDRIVTGYSDGRMRWTDDELREQVSPTADHGALSFENWR